MDVKMVCGTDMVVMENLKFSNLKRVLRLMTEVNHSARAALIAADSK